MRGIEQYLQVDAATLGALKYAGTWNASTNTPTLASGVGTQGQYYVVSVAGSTNLDGETNWQVGDWAVFNGSVWQKVDGGSTGLLSTLTVTGNTYLATTSGNVGVGTTTTTGRMSIDTGDGVVCFRNYNAAIGAGTGSAVDFLDASRSSIVDGGIRATNLTLFGFGATPLTFFTNNTERMRIDSAGNVGIGTSSPSYKLDVVGEVRANNLFRTTDGTNIGLFGSSVFAANVIGVGSSNSAPLVLGTAATERLRITAAGDVGIGTSTPAQKFEVFTSNATVAKFTRDLTTDVALTIGADNDGPIVATEGVNNLRLFTNATERMRITSTGDVGIGTSSPDAKLDVVSIGLAAIFGSETANNAYIGLKYNSTTLGYIGNGAGVAAGSGATDFSIGSTGARALTFGTNDTERMRLDSSGNLGLGVTPSAWSLPAIESQYGLYSGRSESNLVYNAYFNSGFKYISTGVEATRYQQISGRHQWFTAPTGTAGNAISFTQAMTLDASGNLGVGTTSPSSFGIIVAKKDQTADTAISVSNAGAANAATSMSFTLNEAGTPQGWLRRYRDGSGNTEVGFSDALLFTGSVTGTKTERLRITSAGNIHTPAGATTMTNGFFYIPAAAGVPTGVPTAITGTVPMYYDTTNNKFYVYNGAWKSVTLT